MSPRPTVLLLALGIALPFLSWLSVWILLWAFGGTAIGFYFAGWFLLNFSAIPLLLSATTRMYRCHLGTSAISMTFANWVGYGAVVVTTLICWVLLALISYGLLIFLLRDFA